MKFILILVSYDNLQEVPLPITRYFLKESIQTEWNAIGNE